MENIRLNVNIGCTINIGNFENVKLDFGLECDINEDANVDNQYDILYDMVDAKLSNVIETRLGALVKKIRE